MKKGERPPYPIIISNASFADVFWNMNKADLGIFLGSIPVGFVCGRWVVKFHFGNEYMRKRVFNAVYTYILAVGFFLGMNNSAYRLSGLVENGLRWKRKTPTFNKYDFTSHFESNSIWKALRVRY